MHPTRQLMIMLTRIPPQVMIVLVLGMAICTTWLVTGEMDRHQRYLQAQLEKEKDKQPKVVYVQEPAKPAEQPPPDFQAVLKPGYRAISIAVDGSNGSSRFMKPGSHVDIMAITGSGNETEATPILSNIEVVAVGANFDKASTKSGGEPSGSVTVSVTPKDASKILKTQIAAKIYLTLRSDRDSTPLVTSDLVKPQAHVAPVRLPPPPPVYVAPVIRQAVLPVKQVAAGPQVETWSGARKDVVSFKKETE